MKAAAQSSIGHRSVTGRGAKRQLYLVPNVRNALSGGTAAQIPICIDPGVIRRFSAIHQNNRYIVHIGAGGAGDDQAAYGL